jgi:hypothetical protein
MAVMAVWSVMVVRVITAAVVDRLAGLGMAARVVPECRWLMAVMAATRGCLWAIPVPAVPVLIRRPVLVAMVVPVVPQVRCRCGAAPVLVARVVRVSAVVVAVVVAAAGCCSVTAVPVAPVVRALMAPTVLTGLSRVPPEPVVPMVAMAVLAVTAVWATCYSAAAVLVAWAVSVVRADPVVSVVPAHWALISAMPVSMAVWVVTPATVDRPGPAVMAVRGPCCSRSRVPVPPVPVALAARAVRAAMVVTARMG